MALLAGCQQGRIFQSQPQQQVDEVDDEIPLPDVALTQPLLSHIMRGEIAIRAGQSSLAVDEISAAARLSSDPRLAAKATYWALQNDQFEKALAAAQFWLALVKDTTSRQATDARFALAASHLELDQSSKGLAQYRQIIADTTNQDTYKRIAGDLSRLKNIKNAISTMQSLVSEASDVENANVGMAILAARLNDFKLSRQAIEQALAANPANQDAGLIKLSYLFEDDDDQQTERFAKHFLKLNPQASRLRMEYARYLSNKNQADRAIKEFSNVAASDEALYQEATLNIIALAIQEEDHLLAERKLALLLEQNPTDDRLKLYRCQAQRALERFEMASELCREIVFGDYYFPAQLELGNILADQGEIDAAVDHLGSIPVSGTDEQVNVYMRQQNLLHAADELERAIEVLDEALNQYMDDTSLLYARGLILSELGNVTDHERDMRRLIKLEPDNAHAYNALGYTLADLTSRYDEALQLIQKAFELQPEDAYILDSLGWVYFKLNNLDKAKTFLEQAFEISNDAEIAAHLGELYWALGEKQRAISAWKDAQKHSPDNKVLNRTLERFL